MAEHSAKGYALRLIKHRLRSIAEVEAALARKGVEQQDRQEVIHELTEAGLLDDARLAKAWVNDRDRFNPRGEHLLRQELIKKGVSDTIIKETLQERRDREEEPIDEFEQARQVAAAREGLYKGLPAEARRRRLGNYLLRRGFSLGVVRRILDV
jgi:regulatory protein